MCETLHDPTLPTLVKTEQLAHTLYTQLERVELISEEASDDLTTEEIAEIALLEETLQRAHKQAVIAHGVLARRKLADGSAVSEFNRWGGRRRHKAATAHNHSGSGVC